MGTLSPCPWDLPLSGQQYEWWDSRSRPTLSALEPALGSHPCVALSSAQAFSFYLQLASFHGKALARFGLLPPSRRVIQRTGFPLPPHRNGQSYKSVWNSRTTRSEQYYFGPWRDDPKGQWAIKDPEAGWLARQQI